MTSGPRIRDPLHDLITFGLDEFERTMWKVVQTRPFQRLRRVKQLGFSDLVYPGATHSRFAHSIGVFHTARRLIGILNEQIQPEERSDTRATRARAAALVHDIGHGPFSHAFESVGKRMNLRMANHETVSDAIIRDGEVAEVMNTQLGGGFANEVADIIKSKIPRDIYHTVVSSQFDADRLDYMRRDRLMTGNQLGAIDFGWLLSNLEIGKVPHGVDETPLENVNTLVLGPKAIYAAETYVLSLFQLYPTVYFHKTTRGAEMLFSELMFRIFTLVMDGAIDQTGLQDSHPIVRFAQTPDSLDMLLALDDTVVWGALSILASAPDPLISQFASRLRDRLLFKCIDVREEIGAEIRHQVRDFDERRTIIDRICANLRERIDEWISKHSGNSPRVLIDEATRNPYEKTPESKGPLNQINIKSINGDLVDLGEQSEVVRSVRPFKLFRLYVAGEDSAAKDDIRKMIKDLMGKELSNA